MPKKKNQVTIKEVQAGLRGGNITLAYAEDEFVIGHFCQESKKIHLKNLDDDNARKLRDFLNQFLARNSEKKCEICGNGMQEIMKLPNKEYHACFNCHIIEENELADTTSDP